MSDAQGDSVNNNLELKNIFNLLNPNQDGEIEIKQINSLISQLDNLKINARNPTNGSGDNNDQSPGINQSSSVGNGDPKKQNTNVQKGQNQQVLSTKGTMDQQPTKNNQAIANAPQSNQAVQKNTSNSQGSEKEVLEVTELRYFPNNKNTINFNEFCAYFNECMNNKELQEDLLHGCYNQFDFSDEAFINSKKIKSIFEIFNDKTNQEEIQNVLKFCGVSNDKMSYDEFKSFFEKNL